MQITARAWNEYITRLSRLNQKAGQLMREYMDGHPEADTDTLIRYAYALVTKYGEGSAELACQMYDALAEAQGITLPAAEPAPTATYGEVTGMVKATQDSPANLQSGVSRMVKQAGADTTVHNAIRDGAEWAWVPHGDACPFCRMLASNGWQKASKKLLKKGHAQHIHANCDCEFAVRFSREFGVSGYDPERYLRQYRAAGSNINNWRRIDYAARKDVINAQKRAAYQLRQKNRGQKVFITDQAIQKVPLVAPNGANHQTALFIQETHRELLRFAQKQNDSNEVACLLDLPANEKLPFVKGDQATIDIEKDAASYHWLRSKSPGSIMLCHNHPGQSYFSLQDVAVFLKNDSIGTMSIVTNQGKVWTISKTSRFDYDAAFAELRKYRGAAEKEWDDVIDNFLKNGYTYGIGRS